MPGQIRWGILSTAYIGRKVIPAIQKSSNGRVTAIASRSLDKAQAAAKELNIATAYGSYEELIADPNVDAYSDAHHYDHARRAARRGRRHSPL